MLTPTGTRTEQIGYSYIKTRVINGRNVWFMLKRFWLGMMVWLRVQSQMGS